MTDVGPKATWRAALTDWTPQRVVNCAAAAAIAVVILGVLNLIF